MFNVGEKYVATPTSRNAMNGIGAKDDIRIGHVDQTFISVHVIKAGGSSTTIAVPRDAFGLNFQPDRFHAAPPNRGYALSGRASVIYR